MAVAARVSEAHEYLTDFAKRCIALGMADGESWGRAALITRQLALRFGPISPAVEDDLRKTPIAELDAIGERVLSASTLQQALGGEFDLPDSTPEEHLSQYREVILALFRNRPALVAELMRDVLGGQISHLTYAQLLEWTHAVAPPKRTTRAD